MTTGDECRPVRIQRKRTPGWKMPEGTVYVGRPSMFSNPFTLGLAVDYHAGGLAAADGVTETPRQTAVRWFCEWLDGRLSHDERKPPRRHDIIRALKGKNLACWCPRGKACHADVLLEIANGPERALPAAGME